MTGETTELDELLRAALAEDLGEAGDITSRATVPETLAAGGHIVARAPGRVAGVAAALRAFELVDPTVETEANVAEGASVEAGTSIATIRGRARSLLAAERVALNLLGRLSGIATATADLVARVDGTNARIVDTRKTTPLLRALEKDAVAAGGGLNHRMGLYDAVLIKDNHIHAVGTPAEAVARARASVAPDVRVEVEIDHVEDLEAVIEAGADIVLLDNMSSAEMREAVGVAAGRCLLEASGGITAERIREVAETGVDWISVGALTHSVRTLDVGLDFEDL